MELVQHPSMEDCLIEDSEIELPLEGEDDHQSLCNKYKDHLEEEEEDHPSLCDENDDHLEGEYVTGELFNTFHDES